MTSPESFNKRSDSPFWVGPDLSLVHDVYVEGNRMVDALLMIQRDQIPPFLKDDYARIKDLRASVRSRYAQLGIEVYDHGEDLYQHLLWNSDRLMLENEIPLPVQIFNRAARPISIGRGSRLFRSFYDGGHHLTGTDLEQKVNKGEDSEIFIDGEQGKDWVWAYEKDKRSKKIGVHVRISDDKRGWIPRASGPVAISDRDGANFRQEIDGLLKPVPEDPDMKLWIGETQPRIKLGKSVIGILQPIASQNPDGRFTKQWGAQTNSHLIDPGSNWPIRVEIRSSTLVSEMPNYVYFSFVKLD